SRAVIEKLDTHGIARHVIRNKDHPADWTLLITSGRYGDKLPIGFRGCQHTVDPMNYAAFASEPCDLRVVASLPNPLAAQLLKLPDARVRLFAPTLRNMLDRECLLASFASAIDILSCNRREWEALDCREESAWLVSILVVTDGPAGVDIRFTTPSGEPGR